MIKWAGKYPIPTLFKSKNAIWVANGIFRETGKLIKLIEPKDLEEMLTSMSNGDDPSELLLNKLDDLVMDLEK